MFSKFRFKARYIFLGVLFSYIVMCQSCMTMRFSDKETTTYFDSKKIAYANKTLQIGEHQLHYLETGNPEYPTLLFVHGSPGSWDAFRQYLTDSLLLSKYRMIAIDRPGFGYSDFGDAENLYVQTEIIESFIDKINNHKPISLVGHSLGGPVVVEIAAEKPEQFKQIVVLAGSVDPNAETPEVWRSVIKTKPLRYLIPGALRTSNDELWLLKSDLFKLRPKLKNIRCDVTIIHGTKDPLVPYSNVAFMKKAFVNAKSIDVIPIENANHFIPWEHFDLIRDVLYNLN